MVGDEGNLGRPRRRDLGFQLIMLDDGSANALKPLLLRPRPSNRFGGVSRSVVRGDRYLFRRCDRAGCIGQRPVRPALAIFSSGQIPFGGLEASDCAPQSIEVTPIADGAQLQLFKAATDFGQTIRDRRRHHGDVEARFERAQPLN